MGIVTVLIFSINPLILLHTRRAMAEGVLVFGLVLTLYAFVKAEKYPLLAGLAIAVAFNAKHSAVVLLPIGLFAVCWRVNSNSGNNSSLVSNVFQYLVGFFLLTALLNPFLWRSPISAAQEAINQRQNLLARQRADFTRLSPAQVLENPVERIAVLVTQLFMAPPIFSEVSNYRDQTLLAEEEYLRTPGNHLLRNSLSGGFILGFVLLGLSTIVHKLIFQPSDGLRSLSCYHSLSWWQASS
jgi:4-amino-4-deoxy-L-arabinose transferase-like glycosyltransferase